MTEVMTEIKEEYLTSYLNGKISHVKKWLHEQDKEIMLEFMNDLKMITDDYTYELAKRRLFNN